MSAVNEKMTALANAIREKSGQTGPLTIDGMTAAVQGISAGGHTTASLNIINTTGAATIGSGTSLTYIDQNGEYQTISAPSTVSVSVPSLCIFYTIDSSLARVTLSGDISEVGGVYRSTFYYISGNASFSVSVSGGSSAKPDPISLLSDEEFRDIIEEAV